MRRLHLSVLAFVLLVATVSAQTADNLLSFALRGTYTTSSKIFNNPDAPSMETRGQFVGLDNIYGSGFELRLNIPSKSVAVTIAAEYLYKENEQPQLVGFTSPPRRLSVKEGFRLIPIEVGASIPVPLGTEEARLSLGGGIGAYFGTRVLSVAGAEAIQQNKPISYGIHVEMQFDYRIIPGVFARAEMRFRDPEFTTESKFEQPATQSNGVLIILPRDPFRARINVNGLTFGIAAVVELL